MAISNVYLTAIQKFEGFTQKAIWDYAQYTNGYGTRAASPGETITKAEAEERFKAEIGEAASLVDRFAPSLDNGTRSALTSLTFNAGTAWMKSGLGAAVKSGDLDRARDIILLYNKAGGEVLPGLVARRKVEASWIGSGAASATTATAGVIPAGQAADATNTGAAPVSRMAGSEHFTTKPAEASWARPGPGASMTSRAYAADASTQLLARMTLDVLDFLAKTDAGVMANTDGDDQQEA
ncbi:MAG: lysozyme [Hyphomicrobiaceae bacterium]